MQATKIEYLDMVYNPLAMRCDRVSSGCRSCWHLRMCDRLAGNLALPKAERDAWAGKTPPVLREKELTTPLRRKKPARIGVQLMGDLFHDNVPDDFLLRVFNQMRACCYVPGHTFVVLTKRPERMRDFCLRLRFNGGDVDNPDGRIWLAEASDGPGYRLMGGGGCRGLQNIWLGVSVENQKAADERIPILLQTPAAVRWVSVEPMLEDISLRKVKLTEGCERNYINALVSLDGVHIVRHNTIDWVVCGAESGPGARPCSIKWVRNLKGQCLQAGVPFYYKQGPETCQVCTGRGHTDGVKCMACIGHGIQQGRVMPILDGQRWAQLPGASA